MRERLTAAFVASTLILLLGASMVRAYVVTGELRERESDFVSSQARSIGQVVARESAEGEEVDESFLSQFMVPGLELVYARRGVTAVTLTGEDFADASEGAVSSTVFTPDGTLTVSRARADPPNTMWGGDWYSTVGLFALLAVVAGLVGYAIARSLSRPFSDLAEAAAALGRGRFDLDLPRSRVPEVRAISQALESSAAQLRERLEREREFGLLASHTLRTPLTSLRLNLEELVGDPELSEDARTTARSCLATVGRIGEVAGELVEVSGRGVLVAEAAIPLHELATQVSQRWSESLHEQGRVLTAAVGGDHGVVVTPGPVEQVLDLVLEEVTRLHPGAVRLVFEGQTSTLAVDITCEDETGRMVAPAEPLAVRTATVLASLGGVIESPGDRTSLRMLLPRR